PGAPRGRAWPSSTRSWCRSRRRRARLLSWPFLISPGVDGPDGDETAVLHHVEGVVQVDRGVTMGRDERDQVADRRRRGAGSKAQPAVLVAHELVGRIRRGAARSEE